MYVPCDGLHASVEEAVAILSVCYTCDNTCHTFLPPGCSHLFIETFRMQYHVLVSIYQQGCAYELVGHNLTMK